MNILFILESPMVWKSGIWFHRCFQPTIGLKKRGHGIKFIALGGTIPREAMEQPDVVMFGRTYHPSLKPVELMGQFKSLGKRVIYDMDDDFWSVNPDNPSVTVSNAYKDQYEGLIRECDAVITPSNTLKKKVQKLVKGKKVHICPNMVTPDLYPQRNRDFYVGGRDESKLIIGYSGASSHWGDLKIIAEPLLELQKRHDFTFILQGMTGNPLEGEMYTMNQLVGRKLAPERDAYMHKALSLYEKIRALKLIHVPFYPPELHATALSRCDFDIALAPLDDNEFNRGKSCIKFYEYVATGTPCLASDVLPYKEEVNYRAKNNTKDWVKKLEKLIVDKGFRKKIYEQQKEWVFKNRSTDVVAIQWEKALQKPGGLKVKAQEERA